MNADRRRFNEAAANSPRKRSLRVERRARNTGFNEAAANSPRKLSKQSAERVHQPRFNEAAANSPRKPLRIDCRVMQMDRLQ